MINGTSVPNPDWVSSSYQGDEKTPIFCCTCLKESDFIYDSTKKCYVLRDGLFNYSTLKQEFGEYCFCYARKEIGTKAQQALKLQHEQNKLERKKAGSKGIAPSSNQMILRHPLHFS